MSNHRGVAIITIDVSGGNDLHLRDDQVADYICLPNVKDGRLLYGAILTPAAKFIPYRGV